MFFYRSTVLPITVGAVSNRTISVKLAYDIIKNRADFSWQHQRCGMYIENGGKHPLNPRGVTGQYKKSTIDFLLHWSKNHYSLFPANPDSDG